jgi:3-oxoacyl-[acyl-carrier protein] reductase
MLLENKTAIVYGAAGSIGCAVARAYAREGAHVHLAGRRRARLEAVVDVIRRAGGVASAAQLDVLDKHAVQQHAIRVADTSGAIDVCFNATSNDDVQGETLLELPETNALIPHHQPSLQEVADIATFLASDSARTITAAEINLTGGAVID